MRALRLYLALVLLLPFGACDKPIPVAPAGTTITLSVNPTRIEINGLATVTAIVRKEDGTPVNPGTEVNFTTTLGTITALVKTDASGVAETVLEGDGRVGTAMVSASSGAAGVISVEVQIGSVGSSITLTATPTDLPKEGGTVELLALVRDEFGTPLADAVVNFITDIGSLASGGAAIQTTSLGEATDTLEVTRNNLAILEENFFEVVAQTGSTGGALIEDIVEISIRGFASTITLQATPSSVPEAGGQVTLRALVRDTLGDPLEGAAVNFLTDLGTLGSGGAVVRTTAGGQAEDVLTVSQQDLDAFQGNNFNVRAQVGGAGGALLEDSFTLQITSSAPVAAFTFSGQSGSFSVSFEFTGSGEEPLIFEWDFDGDAAVDSTLRNPSHTYLSSGGKTVRLTVTNSFGTDTTTTVIQIPLP